MLGLAQAGEMRVHRRHHRAFVAEIDLDLTEVLALLQQMRGVGMTQRMNVRVLFDTAGLEGEAEGALERGAADRFGGGPCALARMPLGRKEQDGMTVRFPLLAQECERAPGQRDIAVLVTLAGADVQEHALRIDVANFQAQAFAQPQAASVNETQADAMIQGGHDREEAAHLRRGEHDGQFELGIGAGQLQFVRPNALEGFFPEELEGADGLGAGLAGDSLVRLEMDAVLANLLSTDQLGGFAVELTELADAGVIGRFGAWADGQEFEIVGE